jgi:hypothetical protein
MAYGVTYSWPLHEILITGSIAQAKSACNMIWSGLMMLCINTWQTPRQIRKGLNQNIPDIFMQIQMSGYLGRFNNVAKGNSCLFRGWSQSI